MIGIGQPGRIALEFTRDSVSAEAAVLDALEDVRRVIPAAELVEATPDYVGLTDVADVVGVSRQNMRKLAVNHAARFPPPVHEGSAAIWHLADVLKWLQTKGPYDIDPALLEVAAATMQVNLALQGQRLVPRMRREVRARVA